ncbi:MAG: hypothetical protein Q9164_000999 [Protoblastenia rupestris]
MGIYTIRFSDFERPYWPANDILEFGYVMFQDIGRTQRQNNYGLDDEINDGVYRYISQDFQPQLGFSFNKYAHTTKPGLTFRDMYNVLNALRDFANDSEQHGLVPTVDIELVVEDSSPPAIKGWGMLAPWQGETDRSEFKAWAAWPVASRVHNRVTTSQIASTSTSMIAKMGNGAIRSRTALFRATMKVKFGKGVSMTLTTSHQASNIAESDAMAMTRGIAVP